MIKLLALDLDGTLLDSRDKIEYQRWLEKEREEKRASAANNSNVGQ